MTYNLEKEEFPKIETTFGDESEHDIDIELEIIHRDSTKENDEKNDEK